jgi:hypothetical protein
MPVDAVTACMGEMKIAYKISVGKPEMERNVLYN